MTSALLRPVGFRPWEISSLINQEVIDQHAEEAAFLWTQRDNAVRAPQYALKDLVKLDGRVEAHLDGLRIAGDTGWATVFARIEEGRGEVFSASTLAIESENTGRLKPVLDIASSSPMLSRSLVSALGWVQSEISLRLAQEWARSAEPEVRRAGIAGFAIHRVDPGQLLTTAIADVNSRVATRAIKAAAELGRTDLTSEITGRLDGKDDCRYQAAWSLTRLYGAASDRSAVVLRQAVELDSPEAEMALDMLLRVLPFEEGNTLRLRLAGKASTVRLAVTSIGIIGRAELVPELIVWMENEETAQTAGAAFSMITGLDLSDEKLDRDAPEFDDDEDSEFESDYPWPDTAKIANWWARHSTTFVPGVRYLWGKPMSANSLLTVLADGRQPQRKAAALELALRNPASILFETRERGQVQRVKAQQWSS